VPRACARHPDRSAAEALGARAYCAACRDARELAVRAIAVSALPSACFAAPVGEADWRPLASGAAAHWLGHELGAPAPPGRPACAAGLAVERGDLLLGRRPATGSPRAGDLWIDLDAEGCGLVASVRPHDARGIAIAIRHLHRLPARVETRDFYLDFAGRGRFFR